MHIFGKHDSGKKVGVPAEGTECRFRCVSGRLVEAMCDNISSLC